VYLPLWSRRLRDLGLVLCLAVCCWELLSCSRSPSPEEALVVAAFVGDVPRVARLVGSGVNVNYRSRALHGYTALTAAVRQRNSDVVEYLLRAGADPNMADSQKYRPLYLALTSPLDASRIVHRLIEAGASTPLETEVAAELKDDNPNKVAFLEALAAKKATGSNVDY